MRGEKQRAIVAESLAPGAVVTEIACPAEIGTGRFSLVSGDRGRQWFCPGSDRCDRGWRRVPCGAGNRDRICRERLRPYPGFDPGGLVQ